MPSPEWKIDDDTLLNSRYYWYFVCLDMVKDVWIAFKEWNQADCGEAYGSTVNVSEPRHGEIYRLDEGCKAICEKLYN